MDELVKEQFADSFVLFLLITFVVVTWVTAVILRQLAWKTLRRESPNVWESVKPLPLAERTIRTRGRGSRFWFSGEYRKLENGKITHAGRIYNISFLLHVLVLSATAAWWIWLWCAA